MLTSISTIRFELFLAVSLLFGCTQTKKETVSEIVIKDFQSALYQNEDSLFYGFNNYIVLDNNTLYIQNRDCLQSIQGRCGTGLDPNKPPFLKLLPKDLTPIHYSQLIDHFLKYRRTLYPGDSAAIIIASNTKKITGPIAQKITDFKKRFPRVRFYFRTLTEEQQFVCWAKKQNLPYNPEEQKWVIGFDEPLIEQTIPFIEPNW